MELENLRTALENRATALRSEKNLMIPGTASVSILARIERSIKWEIALAFAFAALCLLAIFFMDALSERVFLTLLLAYTILFLFRLRVILNKCRKATDSSLPVKNCIVETISVVTSFMHFYERLTTWFLPLVFIAAMFAAFITEFARSGMSMHFPLFTILASLPLIAAWIWLMRRFSRWWLNRLYGKYLHMLSAQLTELTRDDSYP